MFDAAFLAKNLLCMYVLASSSDGDSHGVAGPLKSSDDVSVRRCREQCLACRRDWWAERQISSWCLFGEVSMLHVSLMLHSSCCMLISHGAESHVPMVVPKVERRNFSVDI